MPRKPRIEFDGAFYHVIARGNQKQKIFRQPADRQKYLQALSLYKARYRFRVYSYVLMDNHVHLLLETGAVPLSKVLQGINQSYTMYFNRTYGTVGHLFQGRCKAILCDRDNYLLALIKYIHLNPLRAKAAVTANKFPWSSHHAYLGKSDPLNIVDVDTALRIFSERRTNAVKRYREFMAEDGGINRGDVYATIDQRIQGSEEFAAKIFDEHVDVPCKKWRKEFSLDQIAHGVETVLELPSGELRSRSRTRPLTRGRALFSLAAKDHGYKGVEIAEHLEKEPSSIAEYDMRRRELAGELRRLTAGLGGRAKT